jgi:hypothetical protein
MRVLVMTVGADRAGPFLLSSMPTTLLRVAD